MPAAGPAMPVAGPAMPVAGPAPSTSGQAQLTVKELIRQLSPLPKISRPRARSRVAECARALIPPSHRRHGTTAVLVRHKPQWHRHCRRGSAVTAP